MSLEIIHMRTRVKICGITSQQDAAAACSAGADAIGLVFYARSPRHVSNEDAAAIWMSATVPRAGVHTRLQGVTIRGDNATATLPAWTVPEPVMIARDQVAR